MDYLAITINNQKIDLPPGVPTGGQVALERALQVGIGFIFIIAIVLSLVYLIYGGLDWTASHGEKQKVESAKKKITFAIIGLAIVFLAFLIARLIGNALGLESFI